MTGVGKGVYDTLCIHTQIRTHSGPPDGTFRRRADTYMFKCFHDVFEMNAGVRTSGYSFRCIYTSTYQRLYICISYESVWAKVGHHHPSKSPVSCSHWITCFQARRRSGFASLHLAR